MFNNKFIKLDNGYTLKLEIYGSIREIYLCDFETKTSEYISMIDLKMKNDKLIYAELNSLKTYAEFLKLKEKYNW